MRWRAGEAAAWRLLPTTLQDFDDAAIVGQAWDDWAAFFDVWAKVLAATGTVFAYAAGKLASGGWERVWGAWVRLGGGVSRCRGPALAPAPSCCALLPFKV